MSSSPHIAHTRRKKGSRDSNVTPSTFENTPVTQWATTTLLNDLTCAICLDLFNDPVTLPCAHNMCKACWETVETFKCPICRSVCLLPLAVNKVLTTIVGVFPIVTQCGTRMLKQHERAHIETCVTCARFEHKHMSSKLSNTHRKLMRLQKRKRIRRVTESSSDSSDDDMTPPQMI